MSPRGGGGQEHRNLKLSQFVREKDHWKYIETGSKNFRGGVHRKEKAIQPWIGHKSIGALRTYERVSTDQERSTCHVPGDVTNQQSLQPTGTHMDPAVLQLQVAKPLNYAVNMSTVPQQQMTPARPTFNLTSCTVNIYYAPVSFQVSASQLTENYKLSHEDLENFCDF